MPNQTQICKTCRPKAQYIQNDSYTLNLMELCIKELNKAGYHDRARKLQEEVLVSSSIGKALTIMFKYLNIDKHIDP
jgi:hypothetical protein